MQKGNWLSESLFCDSSICSVWSERRASTLLARSRSQDFRERLREFLWLAPGISVIGSEILWEWLGSRFRKVSDGLYCMCVLKDSQIFNDRRYGDCYSSNGNAGQFNCSAAEQSRSSTPLCCHHWTSENCASSSSEWMLCIWRFYIQGCPGYAE